MTSFPFHARVMAQKPLVHHITNWVTIYDLAQCTRALGGLPVMAHASEEVAEMVNIASALVLNIGTLTTDLVETMLVAGRAANAKGIPIVLDAVGAGATTMRTAVCHQLLAELDITILKGNAGELSTLAGKAAEVRGVESVGIVKEAEDIVQLLSVEHNCVVAMTGAVDILGNGEELVEIELGHPIMGEVVGTGCMVGSLLGTFAAVADTNNKEELLNACVEAMTYYEICAELATENATGPMDWKVKFLDQLKHGTDA